MQIICKTILVIRVFNVKWSLENLIIICKLYEIAIDIRLAGALLYLP